MCFSWRESAVIMFILGLQKIKAKVSLEGPPIMHTANFAFKLRSVKEDRWACA